ncbi:response regulator [Alkalicoccobacillus gibsonii]|uniref:response regulator n=1 Tax=Alkalicoccobacillus gibsonii TaxID=79881 RepID=UPI003513337C
MMYQVLIVDDEPMIREGLCSLIPWHQYGFRVQGTAKNGKEALQLYQRLKPDVIIVDIRMPEMGGLELIHTIRETDSTIRFIILTGHADFAYAKEALVHRVDGYLLKPLDEEELIPLLKQIQVDLRQRNTLTELLEEDFQLKKDRFITQALTRSNTLSKDQFYEQCKVYGLSAKSYRIMLFQVQQSKELTEREFKQLERTLPNGFVFTNPKVGVILLNEATEWERQLTSFVQAKEGYGAIGEAVTDPYTLIQSYSNAQDLLSYTFLFKESTCLTNDHLNINDIEKKDEELNLEDYVKKLSIMITLGLVTSCRDLIQELTNDLIDRRYQPMSVQKTMIHFYSMVVNKLVLHDPKKLTLIESLPFNPSIIYEQSHIYEVAKIMTNRVIELIHLIYSESKTSTVEKMMELIDKQFAENLRLEGIAELLNYNAAYLGKVFREQTGEYFNTYLDKSRIKYGKIYLEKGYKVYEVSEKVGYKDVDYFHRKFKKYVGISPRAFQKQQILLQNLKQSNIQ